MYISLFTVAIPVYYTSEFREHFEATVCFKLRIFNVFCILCQARTWTSSEGRTAGPEAVYSLYLILKMYITEITSYNCDIILFAPAYRHI